MLDVNLEKTHLFIRKIFLYLFWKCQQEKYQCYSHTNLTFRLNDFLSKIVLKTKCTEMPPNVIWTQEKPEKSNIRQEEKCIEQQTQLVTAIFEVRSQNLIKTFETSPQTEFSSLQGASINYVSRRGGRGGQPNAYATT